MLEFIALTAAIYLLLDIRSELGNSDRTTFTRKNGAVVMDTSALIDGRVLDVYRCGFLVGKVIISKRVLNELQLLADGKDAHKRDRARFGLDVVESLKQLKNVTVSIDEEYQKDDIPTDEAILRLARNRKARLCTTDFNLNKVASVEGVVVLNVNELAHTMRPKLLPGEQVELKIIQKGESRGQGVGYLDDGTLVVVDNAFRYQGKKITATVERMIQTKAGKMIFAIYKDAPKLRPKRERQS